MGAAFAAVDLGASSGRVIVGRLDGGRVRVHEVGRFANRPVAVAGGAGQTLHWDVLGLYGSVLEGLARAEREHGPLAGVGIDTWAVDYGLLDADGALLGNPVHYRDTRTAGAPDRVFARLPARDLFARAGLQVQPFNTIFQLVAAAGSAQLAAARSLLLVPDLLGYWLTGAQVAEVTNASTTGLLDVRARTWSATTAADLEREFAVPVTRLLPELVEPGAVIGQLRPAVADAVGASGAPLIAVGSHDTASAVVAVPAAEGDFAYISSGTWSLVGLELADPVLSEGARAANFTNELGVDRTVRFLRNVMGLWVLQECLRTWRERGEPADLVELLAAARDVPALRCVVDIDDPAFLPPGDMTERIAQAAGRTGQRPPGSRAETVRCILDSLALAYRRAVDEAAGLAGRDVRVIHVVGGGARNALLCQLTADATGLPVVAGPAEGAALGNLLVQARATGALAGDLGRLREVAAASSEVRRYEPVPDGGAWERAHRTLWP
ncbi:rhamnulokinase family protein [Georgenia sp. MJ206]|uniref:rhamnulokinase n=1 Tax=Georgenia wangjunii TaxID=3117730 RepID=UPI002F261B20